MRIVFVTTPWFFDTAVSWVNALSRDVSVLFLVDVSGNIVPPLGDEDGKEDCRVWEPSSQDLAVLGGRYLEFLQNLKLTDNKNLTIKLIVRNKHRKWSLGNWKKLIQLRTLLDGDIIHVQALQFWIAFLLCFYCRHKKIVFDLHDPTSHSGEVFCLSRQIAKKALLAMAREVIIHNAADRDQKGLRAFLSAGRLNVIPLGRAEWLVPTSGRGSTEEAGTVLFFGRISLYKGLKYLFDAVPLIQARFPALKVIIAGAGDFSWPVRFLERNPVYEVINRYVSCKELGMLLQRAAVVVCPYIDASQSGVVVTALAAGKPIVASAVGGIPEQIQQGVTGILVPPRDAKALADAVLDLLQNSAKRQKIKEAIAQKATINWEDVSAQTIRVYRKLLPETKGV